MVTGSIPQTEDQYKPTFIKKGDKSITAWLVALAQNDAQELFRDQFGAPHALVNDEPIPLDSRAHAWLRKLYWNVEHESTKKENITAATETLAMFASHGPERTLHIRAAQYRDPQTGEDKVYVWAGPHEVIEVDRHGWRRTMDAPVLFRRVDTLKPLPTPKSGGDLNNLSSFIRLKEEKDQRLSIAWVVTAYLADIPRPLYLGTGVHGAAKSSGQRALKRLLDPAMPEDFKLGRKDFAQNLDNCYVPMFDNAGPIDEDLADDMCRAVTGSGNADRKLYTDNQSVVRQYKRAILLNGINNPTERGDFMDRALPVEFERVPPNERCSESDLWATFENMRPGLLGAVLDALSGAIRLRAPLARAPRLADWAEYASAVYEYMGWGEGLFAQDWAEVEEKQHEAALEGSPVAQALRKLMEDRNEYEATPTELHEELENVADGLGLKPANNKLWPKTSRWLWRRIKEASPTLETYDIRARKQTRGGGNDKRGVIHLQKLGGVDTWVDKSNLMTHENPHRYAAGSLGSLGSLETANPSTPYLSSNEGIGEGTVTEGEGEKSLKSNDPNDPYRPNTIGKPFFRVDKAHANDPANDPNDPTPNDSYYWEEIYIPELDGIGPRILVEQPPPPTSRDAELWPDGVAEEWSTDVDGVIEITPRSVAFMDSCGSINCFKARDLIREIRADWEGYDLPTDARWWKKNLEECGKDFTLAAVERGLELV